MPNDFLPNVQCPYCGKWVVVAISGFGSEVNSRKKECKFCGREFFVNILVQTDKDMYTVEDGRINCMKGTISRLKNQRKLNYAELLIKYEVAQKINREALRIAVGMKRNAKMN